MHRPVSFRLRLSLAATILAGLTLLGASPASALAAPAGAAGGTFAPQSVSAGVDDFSFASLHADYRLDRDEEGHSTLATTETLVAQFPETDQNKGIRRQIPTHYRGEPTNPTNVRVTDENGTERDYETDTDSDDSDDEFLIITIADDDFVHGEQTYVISYTQKNVAHFPDDTTDEEFFWEVNGTGWAQPFGTVSATVHVAADLVPALTGRTACYQGVSTSGATCDTLDSAADGDEWVIEATARDLGPHEGLALAVGFDEGTFVPRDDSFTANVFPTIALLAALAALTTAVIGVALRNSRWRNRPGRPTIIAEYLPPTGVNLLQAGGVLGAKASGKSLTAQFLQFAVNGNVRVLEGDGKNHYLLELRSRAGIDPTERAVLDALFPAHRPIGTIRDFKKTDAKLGTALTAAKSDARKQLLTDGLREKKGGALSGWLFGVAIVAGLVAMIASIVSFATEVAGAWPALLLVVGLVAAIVTISVTADVRPLTARGAELRDYLKGVSVYISLAEADRLRVLQSPAGALRTPSRPDETPGAVATDPVQVLKLYERLLPFAVLTGQEKEWSTVLGDYYAGAHQQPDWYVGTAPFSAAYFATGVSAFATSASTGIAASSAGSGSSGGGSVGGGGGGGGGGGV
ncbi:MULTISPECIES: DUF2207 domain-containing protein [Cryobacterium]|uniref:DUF2207 domain-containing protein n=1 Tax=Cryobacterium TaxID=69578 RepID=UPI000CD3E973|nr:MULTISPECIES: DUF2207 domain-containing protein [Cryobacterium]POH63154.1 DUF2207 domain-containing protein [Cryobacterium zongtaii]TFC43725.1 DUF2207 domain-containing protein [Cryobacterium sp. TMN-39-2]